MRRWERWSFNVLHGVVAGTGLVYFYMKYVLTPPDEFAVVNHPWQPSMLALHILAAPVFIAFFGIVFRSHTLSKLVSRSAANRRSGWISVVSFTAMALSGYLLQVASSPTWVTSMVWAHVITSCVFVAAYGVHLFIGWSVGRLARNSARPMRRADRIPL